MKAILFHHVGGDRYAFRNVQNWLLPEIESFTYELPGRADRFKEPLLNNIDAVIDDAFLHTQQHMEEPFFFIGMSLGGLIAYCLAHELRERQLPLPAFLFMASRKCPESYMNKPHASQYPSGIFWEYIVKYGGIPDELPQHKELREFYEPVLKADFAIAEDHIDHFEKKAPLPIPAGIYYGETDTRNFTTADATGWIPYFSPEPEIKKFPGGHFFMYEDPATIQHIKSKVLHGG